MLTPETAADLMALIWAVAAFAAALIAVPNAVRLIGMRQARDSLGLYRLMAVLVFGSGFLMLLRNVAVWADFAYFGQAYLGTFAQRWPWDLGIAVLIMLGYALGAFLFVRAQREQYP